MSSTLISEPLSAERLYNMDQLKDLAAGNKEFLVSLASIFLKTIPSNSTDLVLAASSGNWDMTHKLAHKLKSTIDSMNIVSIKTDIRILELDAKNKKNLDSLLGLSTKVNAVIQKVAQQVQVDYNLS